MQIRGGLQITFLAMVCGAIATITHHNWTNLPQIDGVWSVVTRMAIVWIPPLVGIVLSSVTISMIVDWGRNWMDMFKGKPLGASF